MTQTALYLLLLAPLLTAAGCRLLRSPSGRDAAHLAGCAVTAAAGYTLAAGVFTQGPLPAAGLLLVDSLSAYMVTLVVSVTLLAGLYSPAYLRLDVARGELPAARIADYYLWYHVFVFTMLLVAVVDNLGLMWVAIEATTIVSAMLVGLYRTKAALEAAWKYLMLCSVGIIIALFGVLLTYYGAFVAIGESASLSWAGLAAIAPELDPAFMKLALVFVVIGFGAKAGFAPLHTWLPDAHSQAPSPISAVLSGVLLSCALYGILRFVAIATPSVGPALPQALLMGFGVLSVAVAVPFLLIQRDVKRLLAYSSVEHVGLCALAFGIGGPLGLYAGLLHLMNHALVKAFLFLLAGRVVQRYGTRRIAGIRGLLAAAPVSATLLVMGALAITGLPPFSIFVSEFGILAAGMAQGLWPAVALVVLLLAVSFVAILHHTLAMVLGAEPSALPVLKESLLQRLALALPLGGIVAFGLVVPAPVTAALGQVVAQLMPLGAP